MNVIPFTRERSERALARPIEPPAAVGAQAAGAGASQEEFDAFQDRRRTQQTAAACGGVAVLLVTGAGIVDRLKVSSHPLACLEPGHRHCTVLDPRHLPAH